MHEDLDKVTGPIDSVPGIERSRPIILGEEDRVSPICLSIRWLVSDISFPVAVHAAGVIFKD